MDGSAWRRWFSLFGPFIVGALLAGVLLASERARDAMQSLLGLVGSAYVVEPDQSEPGEEGVKRSEYLLILSDDADTESVYAYLEDHPGMRYSGESIYPDTIRVEIDIPLGERLEDLETQSFTRFTLRNLPIFFCH